ncbi:neuronal voltage-dependent calcium channel alpha 2acd domain-containing protein [Phthorimaea operculella]|nr:neuronal voltage-dependent calcium channel alpha 2acd domain-containing protein [Phthorimaea operculella]
MADLTIETAGVEAGDLSRFSSPKESLSLDRYDKVKKLADLLGDELWNLNEALTNSSGILKDYKLMNASVRKKDGSQILHDSLTSVGTMLNRKINAVKCIHAKAKELAKKFFFEKAIGNQTDLNSNDTWKYCSAKYSWFDYEDPPPEPDEPQERPMFADLSPHYYNVSLERDSHFYDININSSISCVHVPTNIFYLENDTRDAILWTRELTEVFRSNYQADPSLAWQYFGTSNGVLRFFPAMPWNQNHVDTYDCRVRTWYIEAATCSKDVIILFDVSGSMTGFKNYVARYTLETVLSTLSNNDFVNVYTFKNTTEEAVDCFKGLVQATPENKLTISETLRPKPAKKKDDDASDEEGPLVHKVPLEGHANLTEAYMKAFATLKKKREKDDTCNVTRTQGCNQMVMVITDYVPGNLSEVFEEFNREVVGNQTYIPVRVFTYLIGKEVTNVQEIQSMACNNRGYFAHIHSVEEVQQQVLKYINVIARPMVLAKDDPPPPTWTHANIDETRTKDWSVSKTDINKPDEDKLVTSVAIPAFDTDDSNENATLLGVAGTDVPIDSIAKLAQPHQLGVNGYSFIVSNNGFLLLHPLLKASVNGHLQVNFNSVDFVEVEQIDDGNGARVLGDQIKELRQSLVDGKNGFMTDVPVLFHYDDMRRIARVSHDYFFDKLNGTPFSMGISLPKGYGDTELMLNNNPLEATMDATLTGVNVTKYFRTNFRVHPDWVYCKYHYLEGHEADTPEIELWRFLANISRGELDISKTQYNKSHDEKEDNFDVSKCSIENQTRLDQNDYYCNEDLIRQVVFDAKLTHNHFGPWRHPNWDLAAKYNVSVRFIATSSGLTRWHYIVDEYKNEQVNDDGTLTMNYTDKDDIFGDTYNKSIEETWYQAAVLQHMVKKESIVVGTKLPVLDQIVRNEPEVINKDGDITVTTSYALFYKDGESETPASVVGTQFSYLKFVERFNELQDLVTHNDKEDFCTEDYPCYVIDSSGYIVLSLPRNISQVGLFFGSIDMTTKLVMQQLLNRGVFQNTTVFNYQALCPTSILPPNRGWNLLTVCTN